MIRKFGFVLGILLGLQLISFSIVNGEIEHDSTIMEHDPAIDFSELLKDEDESKFFTNHRSGDFFRLF